MMQAPIIIEVFSETVPVGKVVSQDPPYTGAHSDPNTVVTLYVSKGRQVGRWAVQTPSASVWTLQ